MKRLFRRHTVLLVVLSALMLGGSRAPALANVSVSVSFGGFYDELSPYGSWVDVSGYGQCWRPSSVDLGWQPYVDGEWIYTDYGWTWVSSDPWGDTPFHYGTWYFEPGIGWVWVPGTVWAPAWVTWYYSDSYVGWAPLPPTVRLSASGYFGSPVIVSAAHYIFVPTNHFVGGNVSSFRVPTTQNSRYLQRGSAITRFDVSGGILRANGPDPRRIESVTHTTIRRASVSQLKAPPRPISAAGSARGSALAIVAPASVKDPEIKARSSHGQGKPATVESKEVHGKPAAVESTHEHGKPVSGESGHAHGKPTSGDTTTGQKELRHTPPPPPPSEHHEHHASNPSKKKSSEVHEAPPPPAPPPHVEQHSAAPAGHDHSSSAEGGAQHGHAVQSESGDTHQHGKPPTKVEKPKEKPKKDGEKQ